MAEPVENEDIEVVSGHSSDDTVTCSHNEPDDQMRSPLAQFPIICHSRKSIEKLQKLGLTYYLNRYFYRFCESTGRFVLARKQPGDLESLS